MANTITIVDFHVRFGAGPDDALPRELTLVRTESDYRVASNGSRTATDSRRSDVMTLTRRQASRLITALAEALDYDPEVDQ